MTFQNATEAFEYYYDEILKQGEYTNNGTIALYNVCFTITNPMDNIITTPWRKFKPDYAEMEWQWYLSGWPYVTEIKKHAVIYTDKVEHVFLYLKENLPTELQDRLKHRHKQMCSWHNVTFKSCAWYLGSANLPAEYVAKESIKLFDRHPNQGYTYTIGQTLNIEAIKKEFPMLDFDNYIVKKMMNYKSSVHTISLMGIASIATWRNPNDTLYTRIYNALPQM